MSAITPNIPFIRDQWIPALRSGEYRQGRTVLRHDQAFCCLGVAADLLIRLGETSTQWEATEFGECYTLADEAGHLPATIRKAIGLSEVEQQDLISLNDEDGKTFPEIADYIEAHILPPALDAKTDGASS